MTTEQQLRQLEAQVDELLRLTALIRQENGQLRERENRLLEERAHLLRKNDLAKARVEAIIVRLQSLEQEDS